MRSVRLLLPLVIAGSVAFPAATAHAASKPKTERATAPITLGAEAWYSNPQLCLIAICLPIASPLPTTYPAGTLHIAASAGSESARTYLSLRKPLAKTTTVTNGTLRLPLDLSPVDGSLAPDLAKVKACTTQRRIKSVSGATTTPPATNCARAPVSRVIGTPATELDINLRPLAKRLSTPGTGLALLPVLNTGATFNVTLSTEHRPKSAASRPVLILSTITQVTKTTPSKPTKTTPTPHHPTHTGVGVGVGVGGGGGGQDSGTGATIPPGPVDIPPATSPVPTDDRGPQLAATSKQQGQAIRLASSTHGFDYPVVFLVPIVILFALLGFGRQLTRPLTVADHRTLES